MLVDLALHDFKSFEDAQIPFAPLTLLVGANASGKSNVLEALRVLKGLSLALGIGEVLNGKAGAWPGVRGGSQEAARIGATRFGISSRWQLRATPKAPPPFPEIAHPTTVSHALEVHTLPEVAIARDSFAANGLDGEHHEWDAFGWGDDSTVHGRSVVGPALMLRADERVNVAWALRHAIASLDVLEVHPDALRGFFPSATGPQGEIGERLIPALHRLLQSEPARKTDVVDWISELCAPKVVDLDFVEVKETGDVMLVLVEEGPGRTARRVTSRSASDGTLRFLALVTALWVEPADGIVVLEEPDLGLHPARLGLLAELLETRTSHVQVIATTHSPALLARLSEDALGDVVAFGRDADTGSSRVSRLRELAHFETLASSRDVAHLFSTGWVERAL